MFAKALCFAGAVRRDGHGATRARAGGSGGGEPAGSLNAAADTWAALGHPRPVLSFASSSALARQIENGAPADLFLSADEEWMDHVGQAPVAPAAG
jgi:hypothetical protein